MTDIYVGGRRQANRGCLILLLILAALIGLGWYVVKQRKARSMEPPPTLEEVLERKVSGRKDATHAKRKPASSTAANARALRSEVAESKQEPTVSSVDLDQVQQLQQKGKLLEAREAALKLISEAGDPVLVRQAEELAGALNINLTFSPLPMPEKAEYTVKSGDILGTIAKKYRTTVELIQKGNGIKGHLIRVGDQYQIMNGKFSIEVNKERNDLVVRLNDRFFKRYQVGTGKNAKTPEGQFKITDKIREPPWWKAGKEIPYGDPENELGTRWMSINKKSYGIHGTWEPETIGHQASAGCIRMLNEEVEELFALVPLGTPVTITP